MSDAEAQAPRPRLSVLTQFAKRVSFENVAANEARNPNGRPNIGVQVHTETRALSEDQHLVSLIFAIKAVDDAEQVVFSVDLDFAGLIRVVDATPAQADAILHVDAPQLLFPFARRIISDVTREGGFPPLMLDPINFSQLYAQQRAQAAAANGAAAATGAETADA